MPAGSARQHHPASAPKSRANCLFTYPVVQHADKVMWRPFFEQDTCKPCGKFGIRKSRVHVLAADRRHKMGGVSTEKNPSLAEAFCHKPLHAEAAFPELANAGDINAGAA